MERNQTPKVVGGYSQFAAEMVAALYGCIFTRAVRVSSPRVAEMTKLLENIYRSINIALVNELKILSMRMDIDIWEVIDAASTKPFYPGPSLGGQCIPVDPFYLSWKAKEFDFNLRFIELAGEVNGAMPEFVVQQVGRALNQRKLPLNAAKILMLGISYKKNIGDLRESPSLSVFRLLQQEGAIVSHNDPYHPTGGQGDTIASICLPPYSITSKSTTAFSSSPTIPITTIRRSFAARGSWWIAAMLPRTCRHPMSCGVDFQLFSPVHL